MTVNFLENSICRFRLLAFVHIRVLYFLQISPRVQIQPALRPSLILFTANLTFFHLSKLFRGMSSIFSGLWRSNPVFRSYIFFYEKCLSLLVSLLLFLCLFIFIHFFFFYFYVYFFSFIFVRQGPLIIGFNFCCQRPNKYYNNII